jgi:hypothetical protein
MSMNRASPKCLRRISRRDKRCYELAFRVIFQEPGAENWTLCHGFKSFGIAIPHAWIETDDGLAYDTTLDSWETAEDYRKTAVVFRTFTRDESLTLLGAEGHYGPWYSNEELAESYPSMLAKLLGEQFAEHYKQGLARLIAESSNTITIESQAALI